MGSKIGQTVAVSHEPQKTSKAARHLKRDGVVFADPYH